jgi:hypothetical protein
MMNQFKTSNEGTPLSKNSKMILQLDRKNTNKLTIHSYKAIVVNLNYLISGTIVLLKTITSLSPRIKGLSCLEFKINQIIVVPPLNQDQGVVE